MNRSGQAHECPVMAGRGLVCGFVLVWLAHSAAQAMTGEHVEARFRGEWVPAKAACNSPLKLVIDAKAVTFVNGAERAEYRKLEQCFSCMGHDVQNMTLLSTDAMGDSPWTITLDGSKKKPALSVAIGKPEKLGARFPLGDKALKKCS